MNRSLVALVAFVAIGVTPVSAQEIPWPHWWFGVFGGANVNMFDGVIRTPGAATGAVGGQAGFTSGTGLGLALGALLEFNSGALLGGNLMIGYDNRSVDADNVGSELFSITTAYISIEPNIRINIAGDRLHAMIGPAVAINVAKSFSYTGADSTGTRRTIAGDLADVRGLVIAGQAGLGYDIPISPSGSITQMLVTPFVQARLGQGLIDPAVGDNDDLGITSIRVGIALKFGGRDPIASADPDVPQRGEFDIALRSPDVITENRTLRETFPMRNYVFFDAGSTDLPERYVKMSPAEASVFREEQLVRPGGEPGGATPAEVRSKQQMQVYYNFINVVGDRMRRRPSTTVKLVGAGGGVADDGKKMAENVRAYLVDAFKIDAKRIAVEGVAMPQNRSGSGASQGEDAKMIAAENFRVTFVGSDEVVGPMNITSVQEEPIDNDVVITIPSDDEISYWFVDVKRGDGQTQRFGPFRETLTARIEAKGLLGLLPDARFTARGEITMKDGSTMSSGTKAFRLVRSDAAVEQTGKRFSILFEFDESKTVATYETFLARTVAPAIPNGATVIIHGHTDLIGTPEYNIALAQRRVEETQRVLTEHLARSGKTVTFDTYGFGEDERRAPFNNVLPEQRYYNRTVVIEVIPAK